MKRNVDKVVISRGEKTMNLTIRGPALPHCVVLYKDDGRVLFTSGPLTLRRSQTLLSKLLDAFRYDGWKQIKRSYVKKLAIERRKTRV